MENEPPLTRPEWLMQGLMRIMGTVVCLALIPVFFPASWMDAIHFRMGMGTIPDHPIVWFLARSLSLLYFAHGAMVLAIASDVRRYRPLVGWLGLLNIFLGAVLWGIDLSAPMPWFWTVADGPGIIVGGGLLLVLHRACDNRQHPA